MAPLGAGHNAHYESPPGEQPVAQLFRCIPENSWLFRYGRIPMSFFLLADWVWRVDSFFFWPVFLGFGRWLTLSGESLYHPGTPSDVN